MLNSTDKRTLGIIVFGSFGSIAMSLVYCNKIIEFIVTGIFYCFFVTNMHLTKRYEDYLLRSGQFKQLEEQRMRYTPKNRNQIMIACLLGGTALGIFLFTIKTIVLG